MTTSPITVALLDDDPEIRTLVAEQLALYEVACTTAANAAELRRVLRNEQIDLVLLDIMLPDGNGLRLCQELRETSRTPVIMLTALAAESDRVLGLEMGADDYLTKPFSPRELVARIRAVLRRAGEQLWVHDAAHFSDYAFEGWRLNPRRRTLVDPSGTLVSLTAGELDLLFAFVTHPGKVLNRDQLLELTRGRHAQAYDRAIDVQLSRLRKKLGNHPFIVTIRGGGYQFTSDVLRIEITS